VRSLFDPSKRNRRSRAQALVALAAVALLGSAAGPEPADSVLAALQARYEGIADLRADFVQEAHVASIDKFDRSSGRVVMQRPGRMRWEYSTPEKRVIVVDEGMLRVYTPSDSQLQVLPVSGAFSSMALGFLLGDGDLRQSFIGERLDAGSRDEIGIRLRPREDSAFERLELWLAKDSHQVVESIVFDLFGNRTSVRFAEIRENVGVDDGVFEIEVPEGTEIVDLR